MDRKLFIELCQKASMLKDGIYNVKENVPDELKVIHNTRAYYPIGYELSFDKGRTIHRAILHDLKANSITYANLERVEKWINQK